MSGSVWQWKLLKFHLGFGFGASGVLSLIIISTMTQCSICLAYTASMKLIWWQHCLWRHAASQRRVLYLSKVIAPSSQWHLCNVASADTQSLCQHCSVGVIFLCPRVLFECNCAWLHASQAEGQIIIVGDKQWFERPAKRRLWGLGFKCQRCLVFTLSWRPCWLAASLGLHSTSSLIWHFTRDLKCQCFYSRNAVCVKAVHMC